MIGGLPAYRTVKDHLVYHGIQVQCKLIMSLMGVARR